METIITKDGITLYFDGKLYYSIRIDYYSTRIDYYTNTDTDNCVYVYGAKKSLKRVVIPDRVEIDETVFTIIGIASMAFADHGMQSIEIGNEVISIEDYAFSGCMSLERVVIGKGLHKIGVNAFEACEHLTTINFPSTLQRIDNFAFCGCDRLNDIYSNINDPNYCDMLGTTFDKDIYQRVYLHVPSGTIELYKSQPHWKNFVHIEDGTLAQQPNQFSHTDGEYLYDTCGATYSLDGTTLISVPKGIAYYEILSGTVTIGKGACEECNLESIYIPDSVTAIGDDAFCRCRSLRKITLPHSIRNIGSSAFEKCVILERIVLPRYLDGIKIHTFRDCVSLENVYIPSCVEYIGLGAFTGCTSLTSIVIPELASIDSFAFQGCTALEAISLPAVDEEYIGNEILEGCSSLKTFEYPYNNITERMFAQCENLEVFEVSGKLYTVFDSAFYFCHSLRKVILHCPPDDNDDADYKNFWRFSSPHAIEFIIPHGSEEKFKRLYEQAANNPLIRITVNAQ